MSPDDPRYRAASAHVEARRAQFLATLDQVKGRVAPGRLKADAKAMGSAALRGSVSKAKAVANDHPMTTAALAVGLFALIFRRPLRALSRRLTVLAHSFRNSTHASGEEE